MNELREETIKKLVTSDVWNILKEEILLPYIDYVKDVTNPIKVGDVQLKSGDAYNTKVHTAEKLKGLILHIEKYKNYKSGSRKLESYK